MREVVVRVPRAAVEDVLDRLLPIVPGGVREVVDGAQVELVMRGPDVPDLAAIRAAAGRWGVRASEREVPDDWRARRLADYQPDVIAGRLVVRPQWAPAPSSGLLDVVLGDSAAFGGGTHPTTRTCLEWLLELEPQGAFADLGCGTGVLAILAARLGWAPVTALDIQPASVFAASENARRNGVWIDAVVADLGPDPPPAVNGFAANVPAAVHRAIADGWRECVPTAGLISGFGPDQAADVLAAYDGRGLRARRRATVGGWVVVTLRRD